MSVQGNAGFSGQVLANQPPSQFWALAGTANICVPSTCPVRPLITQHFCWLLFLASCGIMPTSLADASCSVPHTWHPLTLV